MTVDLFPGPVVAELADLGARFIRETVLPVEDRHRGVVHSEAVRVDLQCAAKEAGFFAPHGAAEYGGHGLDMRGRTAVFEEAGYSLLGPPALNIAAPRHIGILDENLFGGRQSSSSPARPRRTSPAPPSPSTAECPVTVR